MNNILFLFNYQVFAIGLYKSEIVCAQIRYLVSTLHRSYIGQRFASQATARPMSRNNLPTRSMADTNRASVGRLSTRLFMATCRVCCKDVAATCKCNFIIPLLIEFVKTGIKVIPIGYLKQM